MSTSMCLRHDLSMMLSYHMKRRRGGNRSKECEPLAMLEGLRWCVDLNL